MNWFSASVIGWVVLIIALAIAACIKHVPLVWIAIGCLALLGVRAAPLNEKSRRETGSSSSA